MKSAVLWLTLSVFLGITAVAAEAWAASCSVVDTSAVSFGSYDPFIGSPLDSTGSFTYLCIGVGTSDAIVIELGPGNASNASARYLASGANQLQYNLYLDAARTTIWGNGQNGTSTYGPVTPPNGTSQTLTIYGRVPAMQNAQVGSYTDTLTATILF